MIHSAIEIEKAADWLPFLVILWIFYSVPLGDDYDNQITQMDTVGRGGIGV